MVHRAVNPRPGGPVAAPVAHNGVATDHGLAKDLHTREYPQDLDAGLLKIAGVCVLAAVMAILDTTLVSVAQRTFISDFQSTQAVVA